MVHNIICNQNHRTKRLHVYIDIAVINIDRLSADYIYQCWQVCAKLHIRAAIFQIQCNINGCAIPILPEQQLPIPNDYGFIAACPQCRICLVNSAQFHQMAVQIQIAASLQVCQIQAWTQSIIRIVFMPTLHAIFTAVINGRNTRHCIHQRIAQRQIPLIYQRAGKTIHIVVIHKVIQVDALINPTVAELPIDGIVDFKIVLVVVRRINALIAFIVRDRIQHFRICPTLIVAVDDFTHQPEIRFLALAEAANPLEEVKVHAICCIKPNPVNLEFVHPVANRFNQVVTYMPVLQVQLDQIIIAIPTFIPEWVTIWTRTAKVQTCKPIAIRGSLSLFLHIPECPEISADMIEYAVQNDPNAVLVQHFTDVLEHFIRSESAVNLAVISRVITVFY